MRLLPEADDGIRQLRRWLDDWLRRADVGEDVVVTAVRGTDNDVVGVVLLDVVVGLGLEGGARIALAAVVTDAAETPGNSQSTDAKRPACTRSSKRKESERDEGALVA